MQESLGRFFMRARQHPRLWLLLFIIYLAVLVAINFVFRPHHPHIHAEVYVGFWPLFGLGVGLIMAYVVKVVIAHLVSVPEDFYE
jgi:hypothetical protein